MVDGVGDAEQPQRPIGPDVDRVARSGGRQLERRVGAARLQPHGPRLLNSDACDEIDRQARALGADPGREQRLWRRRRPITGAAPATPSSASTWTCAARSPTRQRGARRDCRDGRAGRLPQRQRRGRGKAPRRGRARPRRSSTSGARRARTRSWPCCCTRSPSARPCPTSTDEPDATRGQPEAARDDRRRDGPLARLLGARPVPRRAAGQRPAASSR